MKKRFFSLILALMMLASFVLAGCFDAPQPRIDEAAWQSYFVGVNFDWRPREINYERYPVTDSEYYLDGKYYGLKKVSGQPDYYYMIDRGEEIEIDSSDYIADFASRYSPLITFLHDNFANFTRYENPANLCDEIFIYEQELPADVMTVVSYFMDVEDFATLVVSVNGANLQSVNLLDFAYDGDISAFIDNMEMNWQVNLSNFGEIRANDRLETLRYEKDFEVRVETAFEALGDIDDGTFNCKVVGVSSIDTIEYYFNANGVRIYTPGASEGIDGIVYKNGDTYTYYKQTTAGGAWSKETIDEDRYEETIERYYELFGSGYFMDRLDSRVLHEDGNLWMNSVTYEKNYAGANYSYNNIKITLVDNVITTIEWDMTYEQIGYQPNTYHFTLTVGQGDFTLPNV